MTTDWMCLGLDRSHTYRKDKDIGTGAWVLVKCKIPVSELERPQTYGIYWAIPANDNDKRQKVRIYTPFEVCLLNYEYTIISEKRLQEYRDMGYYLQDFGLEKSEPLNLRLIEKGRSLCDEDREIIMALQLDGLSEQQACEEYFHFSHTNHENKGRCYLPTKEILREIVAVFGEDGIPG